MTLIPRDDFFDLDQFFDNFWSPVRRDDSRLQGFFSPRVDIVEKDDHYEISAELPGVNKDDVHVTLENGVLTLQAETSKEDKEEKDGQVIRQERRYGKFMRNFNLGNNVHEEDISANFKDGVLTLRAPKIPEQVPEKRRIDIK